MPEMVAGDPGEISPILARPWLIVFLPVNAAISGFTVILPLLILFTYHSNVVAVSLSATLYNIFLIAGSLVWGRVCDILNRRRSLLAMNYVSIALIFAGMAELRGLNELLVFYALFGWMAPSGAAASNLLIMERFSLDERAPALSSFNEMNVVGGTAGILAGFVWVTRFPSDLTNFLWVLSILAALSAGMLYLLVPERRERLSRAAIARDPESLAMRLRTHYPFFLTLPSRNYWRKAWRWLKVEATHDVPLILIAAFLFNFSANLFNTSYIPYLEVMGLGAGGIFLVNLANNSVQMVSMPFSAKASAGPKAERSVVSASWARVSGYAGALLLTFLPLSIIGNHGPFLLGTNILLYGVLGLAIAFYATASSLLLFRSLEGRSAGSYLGANSALGGLGAVLGSALSGFLTFRFSFSLTFAVSAVAMAGVVPAWILATRAFQRKRALTSPGSDG